MLTVVIHQEMTQAASVMIQSLLQFMSESIKDAEPQQIGVFLMLFRMFRTHYIHPALSSCIGRSPKMIAVSST
jgi:hypothetical protein